jgi:hypothetical protein
MARLDVFKRAGLIKPLQYTAYHVSEIDEALMTFGEGVHIGKIVIKYDDQSNNGVKASHCTVIADPFLRY